MWQQFHTRNNIFRLYHGIIKTPDFMSYIFGSRCGHSLVSCWLMKTPYNVWFMIDFVRGLIWWGQFLAERSTDNHPTNRILNKLKHQEVLGILLYPSDKKNFDLVQNLNHKMIVGYIKSEMRIQPSCTEYFQRCWWFWWSWEATTRRNYVFTFLTSRYRGQSCCLYRSVNVLDYFCNMWNAVQF